MVRNQEDYIRTSLVRKIMDSLSGNKVDFFKQDMNIPLKGNLEKIERNIIKRVILEEKGNKIASARSLDISKTTLWRRLKKIKNN